jgi:hypothetical protein
MRGRDYSFSEIDEVVFKETRSIWSFKNYKAVRRKINAAQSNADPYSPQRISVRKSSQRNHNELEKIITVMGKSKHEFWWTRLFITVKSEPLIDDMTAQIKRTALADLFQFHHLRNWKRSVNTILLIYAFRLSINNYDITIINKFIHQNSYLKFIVRKFCADNKYAGDVSSSSAPSPPLPSSGASVNPRFLLQKENNWEGNSKH